jgi:voltage-gated potassium channel Kch
VLTELVIAFVIGAGCVVIHTGGLAVLGEWLLVRRATLPRGQRVPHYPLLLAVVFVIIIVLHLIEISIWATFYQLWGLFPDLETSLYFSLGTYTTIGYGDVVLAQSWRILGGIEGLTGVLLSGVSTAFIFVVLSSLFQLRIQQDSEN